MATHINQTADCCRHRAWVERGVAATRLGHGPGSPGKTAEQSFASAAAAAARQFCDNLWQARVPEAFGQGPAVWQVRVERLGVAIFKLVLN